MISKSPAPCFLVPTVPVGMPSASLPRRNAKAETGLIVCCGVAGRCEAGNALAHITGVSQAFEGKRLTMESRPAISAEPSRPHRGQPQERFGFLHAQDLWVMPGGPPWECRSGRFASSSWSEDAAAGRRGASQTAFPRRAWERGILCAPRGKSAVEAGGTRVFSFPRSSVGMPFGTLCVLFLVRGCGGRTTRSVADGIPTQSVGTRDFVCATRENRCRSRRHACFLVPTVPVGMPSATLLRRNAKADSRLFAAQQSVRGRVPVSSATHKPYAWGPSSSSSSWCP